MAPRSPITPTDRALRAVLRQGYPDNFTDRAKAIFASAFLTVHSVRVRKRSLKWNYTFGLGLITLYLFVLYLVSGVLLMFNYIPSVDKAYASMLALQTDVAFGALIINLHTWSGHGLVLFAFLHMLRVFYTGAYRKPRRGNWVIGMVMLMVTLLMVFTGYVLPWDQNAYWAVAVGAEVLAQGPIFGEHIRTLIIGGNEVGQATLTRFYVLHFVVTPGLLLVLTGMHLWRVRRDGGLASGPDDLELPSTKARF